MSGKQTTVRHALSVLLASFFSLACARDVEYIHEAKCRDCALLPQNSLAESVSALDGWKIDEWEGYDVFGGELVRELDGSRISWRDSSAYELHKVSLGQGHHVFLDGAEFFLDIVDDNVAKIVKRDGTITAVEIQASSPEVLGELVLFVLLHPEICKSPWGEDE